MGRQSSSEEKLRFSELRYRRLFEAAQDGILILDFKSGKILDANPFLQKLLGYSEIELLGKELWQIGIFKDIINSKKAFRELQRKEYIRYKDLPLQTKSGVKIEVEFVSNVYLVDTQKVIQCNIRDISDRKKAEREVKARTKELEHLSKKQEKIKKAMLNVMEDLGAARDIIELEKTKVEAVLASIGEGLIAVDTKRKITMMNKAAEELLQWNAKDLVGKEINSLSLEDENGNPMPLDKRPTHLALTTGKPINTTYFFVRQDKTRFPIAINVTPIKLNGKIIGAIDIFRDVTHEKEIDKAKSEFVSLASHQLRTPLGIIKWYLEALENEAYFVKAPSAIRKYFTEIYKSNERVLSLVRDLLSVSRIDQGQVKNTPKSVSLLPVITQIVEQMQIVALKKEVRLHLDIQSHEIPPIKIDVLRFHEALENLIENAIEYTSSQGAVTVLVQKEKNALLLSVQDQGIGISQFDQKRLFTKFFRSEKAIGHNPQGAGLGLYVVRSYVEGWGGKVSAASEEGKGSTFTMSLPL